MYILVVLDTQLQRCVNLSITQTMNESCSPYIVVCLLMENVVDIIVLH